MIHKRMPESWFTPRVTLDGSGNVDVSALDRDLDERYERGEGIIIPVASVDGKILSEKRQKTILKHFRSDHSRTRFDYMVGVLRRDPDETVTQIVRWCELFRRITGKRRYVDALERMRIRAFAVCAPRDAADADAQRKAFTPPLEMGLPTAIYQLPTLSRAEVDPALIRELVHKYDNLVLVFDPVTEPAVYTVGEEPVDEAVTDFTAALAQGTDADTHSFELVGGPQTTDFVLVKEDFKEAELSAEYREIARERSLVPYTAQETALVVCGSGAEVKEKKKKERFYSKWTKSQKLRRLIAAELVACLLLAFAVFDTVQVQAAEKRSIAIAEQSADRFLANASPVVADGSQAANAHAEEAIVHARIERIRDDAMNLEYIEEERSENIEESETYKLVQSAYEWNGPVLNMTIGTVTGPNGRETYYNLNMEGVVSIMRRRGNTDTYWVRSDGCKMLGNYIMVAANLDVHPRGSIVRCSRGLAMVCDTGGFAVSNPQQLDVATAW